VPGVSDNIRVRSVVGRFLEHTRVFWFQNDGAEELFCSSADWMDRNFFRRLEVAFPIQEKSLRARVVREALQEYLADNTQAWELQTDGSYRRCTPDGAEPRSAQGELLKELAGTP
jgi:polyphosphate kinase